VVYGPRRYRRGLFIRAGGGPGVKADAAKQQAAGRAGPESDEPVRDATLTFVNRGAVFSG